MIVLRKIDHATKQCVFKSIQLLKVPISLLNPKGRFMPVTSIDVNDRTRI